MKVFNPLEKRRNSFYLFSCLSLIISGFSEDENKIETKQRTQTEPKETPTQGTYEVSPKGSLRLARENIFISPVGKREGSWPPVTIMTSEVRARFNKWGHFFMASWTLPTQWVVYLYRNSCIPYSGVLSFFFLLLSCALGDKDRVLFLIINYCYIIIIINLMLIIFWRYFMVFLIFIYTYILISTYIQMELTHSLAEAKSWTWVKEMNLKTWRHPCLHIAWNHIVYERKPFRGSLFAKHERVKLRVEFHSFLPLLFSFLPHCSQFSLQERERDKKKARAQNSSPPWTNAASKAAPTGGSKLRRRLLRLASPPLLLLVSPVHFVLAALPVLAFRSRAQASSFPRSLEFRHPSRRVHSACLTSTPPSTFKSAAAAASPSSSKCLLSERTPRSFSPPKPASPRHPSIHPFIVRAHRFREHNFFPCTTLHNNTQNPCLLKKSLGVPMPRWKKAFANTYIDIYGRCLFTVPSMVDESIEWKIAFAWIPIWNKLPLRLLYSFVSPPL